MEKKTMTEVKMQAEYHDAIMGIFKAGGSQDDTNVCYAKLVHMYKLHEGLLEPNPDGIPHDVYPGVPEDFDYEKFGEDYALLP